MQDASPLGTRIRERRRELGLSLSQLAAATGLHKSFLSRLECGAVRQPAAAGLQRIATALRLPDTDLFGLLDARARDLLPPLQPYLRAKYELPDEAIAEISAYLMRYGGAPCPGEAEDEKPDTN